jgi:catalase
VVGLNLDVGDAGAGRRMSGRSSTKRCGHARALLGQKIFIIARDVIGSTQARRLPKWRVSMQIMLEKEAETYHINPFDRTKVWPQGD